MGRHTGFLLCLAMLLTVAAGQFGAALTAVAPGATSPHLLEGSDASGLEESASHSAVARSALRVRTIPVAANSLFVITSLDSTGSPHTFHLRSERVDAANGCPAGATIQGQSDSAGGLHESRPVGVSRWTQRKLQRVISTDWDTETASVYDQKSPQKSVDRRFIAPRYGNHGVSDIMVSASLLFEEPSVAIYLDQSLPCEIQAKLRSRQSVLSPGLVSKLALAVAEQLGPIHDLDHDGQLCVLVTELDCQSDTGTVPVLGCVRPSDFMGTGSNEAELTDVVYLDHRLPSGNDLVALLSHELAHASVYCRLRDRVLNQKQSLEIPEWLHEGIAHYVESQFAEETSVFLERREQFHRTPHRFPVCTSPFVSSRSDRRGGSRAAVARFLEFAFRREEPLRDALMEADSVQSLLASCLREDLADLLPAWSLLEAGEIYRTAGRHIPELIVDRPMTHEVLGTAFAVVRSGPYPVKIEVRCADDSEWTALSVAISESAQSTELSVTGSIE